MTKNLILITKLTATNKKDFNHIQDYFNYNKFIFKKNCNILGALGLGGLSTTGDYKWIKMMIAILFIREKNKRANY